jgi:hypothetical protein
MQRVSVTLAKTSIQGQLFRPKPQSLVAKVERGERRIDVIEFIAIATALGSDPVRLLKGNIGQKAAPARGGVPTAVKLQTSLAGSSPQSASRLPASRHFEPGIANVRS